MLRIAPRMRRSDRPPLNQGFDMIKAASETPLNVLIVRERGCFLAQCLEYDIAAHGDTVEEAKQRLIKTLLVHLSVAQKRGREPFVDLPGAPAEYVEKWRVCVEAGAARSESLEVPATGLGPRRLAEAIVAE